MPDSDLTGTVLDGRYKVIEPIADGAMGSVWRGERLKLGRAVAIKIMHMELPDELASRQRFEREAKLMALLEHPNCVSVIDFGLHDDKPFLVMDLVRGTSLLEVLDSTGKLDIPRAGDIIRQVLSGLAHAHELGIVHRDIKPANIMISERAGIGRQVRILDFGLARLTESNTKLTTGIVVGTPNYMAPEQCRGGDIDARTDLYSCGIMLFEMLTGRKPFVADDPIQVVRKHLLEKPPTLAAVVPDVDFGDLEQVIAKALSKASSDRYGSAVEMTKAIETATNKLMKISTAAVFARAVPEGARPFANQQATQSGWTVSADPSAPATDPSGGSVPAASPARASSGPSGGSTSAPARSATGVPTPASGMAAPGSGPRASSAPPHASSAPSSPHSAAPSSPHRAVPSSPHGAAPSSPHRAVPSSPHGAAPSSPHSSLPHSSSATGRAGSEPGAAIPSGRAGSEPGGAIPNAPLAVPPTRPSTAPPTRPGARFIPELPFTKKQLMIGAGALLTVIILIAVIAGGSSKKKTDTPVKTGSESAGAAKEPAKEDPLPKVIERGKALVESQDYEEAAAMLKSARKSHPESAELAFLAGKAYFGELWWSDGVDNFRDAIKLDESYKTNPDLLKTVLKGFLTTPDIDDRITDFMRHDLGAAMRPYLEETADKHPKKAMRARARAELNAEP